MAFLFANMLLCERVLREPDNVMSVIRIVDYFTATLVPDIPIESQSTPMVCLSSIHFSPDDEDRHSVSLTLIRPDGDSTTTHLIVDQPIPAGRVPEMPRVVWIQLQIGITLKVFGLHHFLLTVDGKEVARAPFMLARQALETQPPNLETKTALFEKTVQ